MHEEREDEEQEEEQQGLEDSKSSSAEASSPAVPLYPAFRGLDQTVDQTVDLFLPSPPSSSLHLPSRPFSQFTSSSCCSWAELLVRSRFSPERCHRCGELETQSSAGSECGENRKRCVCVSQFN